MKQFIIAAFLFVAVFTTHAQFAGGDGTMQNPYQITTVNQLDSIRYFKDKHFVLLNNLNIADWIANHTDGDIQQHGWKPIDTVFTGSFDGQGFSLQGLSINRPEDTLCGLFSVLSVSSVISNLKIDPLQFTIGRYGGILAGYAYGSHVNNCTISGGNIQSNDHFIGALIGYVDSTDIQLCITNCSIVTDSFYVGGIVGTASRSQIENCHATGSIQCLAIAGGIAGVAVLSNFSYCHYEGAIVGSQQCGGIVGNCNSIQVNNCYAKGKITVPAGFQSAYSGGLVGLSNNSHFKNNYAANNIYSEPNLAGGLIGYSQVDTIRNCYASGIVNGYSHIGGLVGFIYGATILEQCVAANAEITTSTTPPAGRIYGILQLSTATLSNNFAFDKTLLNDEPITNGTTTNQNGENLSGVELSTQQTYTQTPLEWNFTENTGDWKMSANDCLPILAWQEDSLTDEECYLLSIQNPTKEMKMSLKVYPNPVTDYVTISSETSNITEITMFNSIGKQIPIEKSNTSQKEVRLDLKKQKEGLYLLNIQTRNGVYNHKIIKTR